MGASQSIAVSFISKLKEKGYTCETAEKNVIINGPNISSQWPTLLLLDESKGTLISLCVVKCPKSLQDSMNAFLISLNNRLVVGSFDMDFSDGKVLLRSSVPTKVSIPVKILVSMFERHVSTLKQYADMTMKYMKMPPSTELYHFGITCDSCATDSFTGERFKCKTCRDYDLCPMCRAKKIHSEHTFSLFKTPFSGPEDDSRPLTSLDKSSNSQAELVFKLLEMLIADKSEKKAVTNQTSEPKENPSFQPKEEKKEGAKEPPTATPMSPLSTKIVPVSQIQFTMKDGKKVLLGSGGFAKVFAAKWHGTEVAVKVIKEKIPKDMRETFKREVNVMSSLRHPHIVMMLGLCEEPPSILMPIMKKGSLQHVIDADVQPPFKTKVKYLVDAAKGMAFVHGNYILHGDLKPLNILVDGNDVAYVADFGLAKIKASTAAMAIGSNVVGYTLVYSSPELLDDGKLAKPGDLYAFGVIMWATATCKTPFLNQFSSPKEFEKKISAGMRPDSTMYPPNIPQEYKDLAAECWHKDPSKRPEFITIIDRLEAIYSGL